MGRIALALCLSALAVACEQPASLEVQDAWARDTVGNTTAAAVYMTITSPTPDRLLAASAPVAGRTDLMTMTTAGGSGAMAMAYIEAIEIPAGEPVSLDPAGLHVWLAELDRPLTAGQTFPLSLEFENAGGRKVDVSVIAPAATPPMPGMEM